MGNVKWFLLCSFFLFLSCPGLVQAPPAKPGSGIPIAPGSNDSSNVLNDPNALYPGHPNDPNDPNNLNNPNQKNLPITLPSDRQWGLIRCDKDSWTWENFNQQFKNFLSTSSDPARMNWWLKCDFNDERFKDWKGGVFIKGKTAFQRGKFNPESQSQSLAPSANSYLEIHLVDHLGKTVIKPIKMSIDELSSSINGNNISLLFKDSKGEVTLEGNISKSLKINDWTISGKATFINYVSYTGNSRQKYGGFLGYFEIPACSFLDCDRQQLSSPRGL